MSPPDGVRAPARLRAKSGRSFGIERIFGVMSVVVGNKGDLREGSRSRGEGTNRLLDLRPTRSLTTHGQVRHWETHAESPMYPKIRIYFE